MQVIMANIASIGEARAKILAEADMARLVVQGEWSQEVLDRMCAKTLMFVNARAAHQDAELCIPIVMLFDCSSR